MSDTSCNGAMYRVPALKAEIVEKLSPLFLFHFLIFLILQMNPLMKTNHV